MAKTKFNTNQINLGDESAIDLLISQNKAKTELAENLQGLGVSADASTDTLEQLAYKVSTVSVDNNRQKPKCLAIKFDNCASESYNDRYGDGFIIKNGWFFYRYYNGSDQLRGAKLSNLNISNYDTNKTIAKSYGNIGSYSYASDRPSMVFNEDGTHLYVMCDHDVKRYTVSGYDGNTISLSSVVTYAPTNDGNEIEFYNIDISADETKMSIVSTQGDFYYMDLTGSTTPDLPIIDNSKNIMKFKGSSNVDFLNFTARNVGSCYLDVTPYNLNNGILTNGTTITFDLASVDYWLRGIEKYKDTNNNYKFIMHLGGYNRNIPGLVVMDATTLNYTKVYSKINYLQNAGSISKPIVTIINNYYYIIAAMSIAIFDSNWNLVGNIINQKNPNDYYFDHSFIYNNDLYSVGEASGTMYFMKHKMWLDKLVAYQRTVDIDYYVPYYADWTENGILAGYFD